jgi:hypothetical protein
MNLVRFGLFFFVICFIGCSNTVSSSSGDEQFAEENSSSSKDNGKNEGKSSSSQSSDENSEECVGESGSPWDGTTAKEFACGSGTKLSPYVILNAEQLAHLSFVVGGNDADYIGKYYKLGADILLNDGKVIDQKGALVADSSKLHKWTPIGNSSVAFSGHFDGNGFSISGMFINTTSSHNGLFGNVSGSVSNLTVENSWVTGGKFTGGIVGLNIGTLENLKNKAAVIGNEECAGGVIGKTAQKQYRYNSVLKNISNSGIVVGKKNVGGVSGCATYVTIDGLENSAIIEGEIQVGGVIGGIGSSSKNDIKNLKNTGDVLGQNFVGGVSGHCGASVNGSTPSYYCSESSTWSCGDFSNASNTGLVVGKNYVGGVFGIACSGTISNLSNVADIEGEYGTGGVVGSLAYVTSKNIYNTGNIFGRVYAGGIFSYNKEGVTSAAYSTGKVDGDSLVGLMIGYNYNTTMADYYYLEQDELEPFGENNGGGVATPKTASEMKTEEFAELVGEDFVYDSGLNDGYPVLSWEVE